MPPGPFQAPGGGELRLRRGLARGNPLARRSQAAPLWEVPAPAALRGTGGFGACGMFAWQIAERMEATAGQARFRGKYVRDFTWNSLKGLVDSGTLCYNQ